ncbi:MAG: hypothetical protein PVI11_06635 [Candidatus Aminicenantes bacterium]|jgi:hypothetical protein
MKKLPIIVSLIIVSVVLIAQEIQHEAVAINIEVSVRVFKGDTFIDNLTIEDFEVYEDGILQKVDAVYLVKKDEIIKKEEKKPYQPATNRNFVLCFFLVDYLPRVNQAISAFLEKVYTPGDSLLVLTPTNTYNLKPEALTRIPRDKITEQLQEKIRRDVLSGNSEYRSLVREMEEFMVAGGIQQYEIAKEQALSLRYASEKRVLAFADYLKQMGGQKTVFLFFQQESLPVAVEVRDTGEKISPVAGEIKVKVKGQRYKIFHRAGYIAD